MLRNGIEKPRLPTGFSRRFFSIREIVAVISRTWRRVEEGTNEIFDAKQNCVPWEEFDSQDTWRSDEKHEESGKNRAGTARRWLNVNRFDYSRDNHGPKRDSNAKSNSSNLRRLFRCRSSLEFASAIEKKTHCIRYHREIKHSVRSINLILSRVHFNVLFCPNTFKSNKKNVNLKGNKWMLTKIVVKCNLYTCILYIYIFFLLILLRVLKETLRTTAIHLIANLFLQRIFRNLWYTTVNDNDNGVKKTK